jgi:hypothetical protein
MGIDADAVKAAASATNTSRTSVPPCRWDLLQRKSPSVSRAVSWQGVVRGTGAQAWPGASSAESSGGRPPTIHLGWLSEASRGDAHFGGPKVPCCRGRAEYMLKLSARLIERHAREQAHLTWTPNQRAESESNLGDQRGRGHEL